jgi:AcrR family transcriptional regulator
VVINTTFEDLLMHGFSEVTVESISVEAGIVKTSIYCRWPTN